MDGIFRNNYPHDSDGLVSSFVSSCLAYYKEIPGIGGITAKFRFLLNIIDH